VIGVAQGERLEVRRRLSGSGIACWHHGIDMGGDTVVLSLPQSERDLLFRKVLLSHPQNPPFSGDAKVQNPNIPDGSRNGKDVSGATG
jgi:hypothetical protein